MPKTSESIQDKSTLNDQQSNKNKALIASFVSSLDQFTESNLGTCEQSSDNQLNYTQQLIELIKLNHSTTKESNSVVTELRATQQSLLAEVQAALKSNNVVLPEPHVHLVELTDTLFLKVIEGSDFHPEFSKAIMPFKLLSLVLFVQHPKLLFNRSNPLKPLLDALMTCGLIWQEGDNRSQQISQQIKQALDFLSAQAAANQNLKQAFKETAQHLAEFAQAHVKRIEIFEKRIKEAEEGKAKAEQADRWANIAIEEFLYKENTPDFIIHMLKNAWRHILYLEYLKAPELEAFHAIHLAKCLLVSTLKVETVEELEKFLEIQDQLYSQLKIDLAKTSYSHAETTAFFQQLDALHSQIILDAKSSLEQGPKEKIIRLKPATPFESELFENSSEDPTNEEDISKINSQQWVLKLFSEIPNQLTDKPSQSQDAPKSRKEKDTIANKKSLDLIKPGRWLNYIDENKKTKCKLASYIKSNDKYILVTSTGTKFRELSSQQMLDKLQSKQVTMVEDKPLYELAFQSVISELFKNIQAKNRTNSDTQTLQTETAPDLQEDDNSRTAQSNSNKQPNKLKTDTTKSHNESLPKSKAANSEKNQSAELSKNKPAKEEAVPKDALAKQAVEKIKVASVKTSKAKSLELTQSGNKQASEADKSRVNKIAVGTWVKILINDELTKCRLAAKISSTGKFIFTDRSGLKIKECLLDELAHLYVNKQLLLDENDDVFDQALASVISNMRNLKSDK
ncbi:DUF1631 family protein [Aliikangiella sp. IMCC44653]